MSAIQQMFPFNNPLVRRILNAQWKQGDEEDTWRNKAIDALVKKLKKESNDQYGALKTALNVKCENTPCVTLTKSQDGRLQVYHRKMLPHLMSCRIFRWPDLQQQTELTTLPSCETPFRPDRSKVCVNPYHYTRVDRNHSIYPPVVTPRNQTEFANASPPQSPMSPGSQYSAASQQQQPGSPAGSYFSTASSLNLANNHQAISLQASFQTQSPPLNQQENHLDTINYLRQNSQLANHNQHQQHMALPWYASQQSSPVSESNWYGPNGHNRSNGDAINGGQNLAETALTFESQTPPPGYLCRDSQQQQQLALLPMDTTENTHQMNTTLNGSDDGGEHWCKITYAELNQKIGEPFKGSSAKIIVDGFTEPSVVNSSRFSLGVLSNTNRNSTIEMTRRAIRKGICLENNDNQIYVLNMSDSSIFFHSKNCNVENQLNQHAVVKIEPQVRQKIFDQKILQNLVQEAMRQEDGRTFERLYSLIDHCIIKMSFVKGWGSIYQRQDVTSTPCWIEIHLLKPYALIDQYLRQSGPPSVQITSTS